MRLLIRLANISYICHPDSDSLTVLIKTVLLFSEVARYQHSDACL